MSIRLETFVNYFQLQKILKKKAKEAFANAGELL